jgi:hypothetical protein
MNNEEKIASLYEDLKLVGPIHALSQNEGGKLLVKTLLDNIVSNVTRLSTEHGTLSHIEMISICADIKSARDVVRALSIAETNKKFLEDELKATLAE